MDVGSKNFYVKKTKILMNNLESKDYVKIRINGKDEIVDLVDIIEEVQNYYTYEEWKKILPGFGSVSHKTTRSKKYVMYRFIRQYVSFFVLNIFDEIQKNNKVVLGKGDGYLSFHLEAKLIRDRDKLQKYYYEVKVERRGSFYRKIRLGYVAFLHKNIVARFKILMNNYYREKFKAINYARYIHKPRYYISQNNRKIQKQNYQ